MQSTSGGESMKEHVVDTVPKRIKEIEFGIQSNQDIVKQSVLEISSRELYVPTEKVRTIAANGPLDGRLGTSRKGIYCDTCGEPLQTCNGHFGYVRLALPVFHIGYFRMIIEMLQDICKNCSRILLTERECRQYLYRLRLPNLDSLVRDAICKHINAQCRKTNICHYCKAENGVVKKAPGPLKIIHDKYRKYNSSTAAKKKPPLSLITFEKSFINAKKGNPELAKHVKKAVDDLNPLRVLHLFQQITATDCELLGMNPSEGRPEMFIWQYLPAPPVCIRPSVVQDNTSTEDEITSKLGDIVNISSLMRIGIRNGQPVQTLMEQWDYLQISVAMYINSNVPGLTPTAKPIRGFCQRLKGKQGRFRGNLSGKRVDFSGRTVISPDPNLGIDEVAIPIKVAMNLTYPETVTKHNRAKLQSRVRNAIYRWPGANYLTKKGKFKTYLKFGRHEQLAEDLEIGDVVERHLEDGDIVLFNRQPSLHKLSILSHYVKVRPWRTFRLNECVCTPYNADFDGDEMNLHVPQTEEARTEAIELMGVKHNLATPKNGEPIIAAIQDFITASYLLTNKDNFFNRRAFTSMCMSMVDGNMHIDVPPPAVYKPEALWTGKQVFNVLIRPNKASPVKINLDAPSKQYRPVQGEIRDLDENDGWMIIRNSEIMCGIVDKSAIGAGKKESIFNIILRDFGADEAVGAMNRLSKLSARWLTNQGFSVGIGDVTPGLKLVEKKQSLVEKAYAAAEDIIKSYSVGMLKKAAGCDEERTMENQISGLLNRVRQDTGKTCIQELSRHNSPLIMATSGSKGSEINVAQMVAVVGQQIIGGARVPDGFQDRSLPHFPKNSRLPPSKGFVRNSFFSGLNPTEFLFHAISGREGLVDTAVKTAETGYMSRRLMKSLEDLSTQYDDTVRNSASGVVQFKYGDDKLDPVDMEVKGRPVNFERAFTHAEATTWSNSDPGLSEEDVLELADELLQPEEDKFVRVALDGTPMDYRDDSLDAIDQLESGRDFLASIKAYLVIRSQQTLISRTKHPLPTYPSRQQDGEQPTQDKSLAEEQYAAEITTYNRELAAADRIGKISAVTLRAFIITCLHKYKRAQVEPGHAVGAVGAQSIGEPGTQMTLKTFHFAGVAGMSITQGVPRIKEIINASKIISTPVITCQLEPEYDKDVRKARRVKACIEKTYLRDIIKYIEEEWKRDTCYISLRVDFETQAKLGLEITTVMIRQSILAHKKFKIQPEDIISTSKGIKIAIPTHHTPSTKPTTSKRIRKPVPITAPEALFAYIQHLKRTLPNLAIAGAPLATRAVLQTSETKPSTTKLLVEGYGLAECMRTPGVDGLCTTTNSVLETYSVLGIEAARATIAAEISLVMADMDIDPRHMALLADVMTYRGSVLGITRFGLAKMRESVLQLASFEKTPDHLFDAAWRMKRDQVKGVSECIIMGQAMGVGTGAMRIVKHLGFSEIEDELGRKRCVFEEAWQRRVDRRRGVIGIT